jgi:hypothetical protein
LTGYPPVYGIMVHGINVKNDKCTTTKVAGYHHAVSLLVLYNNMVHRADNKLDHR